MRHRWRRGNPVAGYFRMRMHRRIFAWFGLSIALMFGAAVLVVKLFGMDSGWRRQSEGLEALAAEQFERVWDDPEARAALGRSISEHGGLDVELHDVRTGDVRRFGDPCRRPDWRATIARAGQTLGTVEACWSHRRWSNHGSFFLPFLAAAFILWMASGRIARRVTRPLGELTRVTQEIGAGNLKARAQVDPFRHGEAGILGAAINDMAGRIERQMADQRELLAAVSHELRTPLSRIRLLTELARGQGADKKALDDVDQEVMEIDALVGDLLASSRLDFAALSLHRLEAVAVARRALERAGVSAELLQVDALDAQVEGDATLLARALANLLENAKTHGGGVAAVRVKLSPAEVAFEVEDRGKGFPPGEDARAFDAFTHRAADPERDHGGLGLGLSLVKRIAEAHHGRAYAQNRPEGGARVGFTVRRT